MFSLKANETIWKYTRYCIVGALGRTTDFLVYTILVKFFLINYLIANIFSLSSALILTYSVQKNWTFKYTSKDTRDNVKTFQRYAISVLITFILDNVVLVILIGICGYNVILSKVIQIGLGIVWGYCLTNFYVFNKKRIPSEP